MLRRDLLKSLAAGPAVLGLARAAKTGEALVRTVDLDTRAAERVTLANGERATVRVLGVRDFRDPVRNAVRRAEVDVEVDGARATLVSGNYHLPRSVGEVQVDCPMVGKLLSNTNVDRWGLVKDVRLRLWPGGSPWMPPGSFTYPARQKWFATNTQMSNEPSYVNGGERFDVDRIYYHSGLDIGGPEELVEVVAATDGLLVQVGTEVLDGHEDVARPRYDVLYVRDARDWAYRYSHLHSFAPGLRVGQRVRQGQKLGLLGKEGASGGWSHLHFEIVSKQPSGEWGTQEGYAFLWEAYLRQYTPKVIAVARPHRVALVGEKVPLDASKSWAADGVASYEWTLTGGRTPSGAMVETTYSQPGTYSEMVKVMDTSGRFAYDFTPVEVLERPAVKPPCIHAAYHPTLDIQAGQPITFKVRTFGTNDGKEAWDFGDGSDPVQVKSDGGGDPHAKDGYAVTTHTYGEPGSYIANVERTDSRGYSARAKLWIEVG